ncbi:IS200/IS605 family transposase, partial [Serratia sp. CY44083]
MNRYESASHVFYRCQYHLVWTPKFGYKILKGNLGKEH